MQLAVINDDLKSKGQLQQQIQNARRGRSETRNSFFPVLPSSSHSPVRKQMEAAQREVEADPSRLMQRGLITPEGRQSAVGSARRTRSSSMDV